MSKENNIFLNSWLEKWIHIPLSGDKEVKQGQETEIFNQSLKQPNIEQQVFNNAFLGR